MYSGENTSKIIFLKIKSIRIVRLIEFKVATLPIVLLCATHVAIKLEII